MQTPSRKPHRRMTPVRCALAAGAAALAGAAEARQEQPEQTEQIEQPQAQQGVGETAQEAPELIDIGRFSEPVDLESFVEFVGATLDVNIMFSEADLSGRTVEFKAPIRFPREELLPLLETLLAQQGYGLTRTDQGWLMVVPIDRLPVTLDGDLATTRIIPTPLVRPSALQQAINTMLGGGESAQRRIAYLDELGVIISTAPPRLNDSLTRIVDRLLAEQAGIRLRQFDLTHVAAEEARRRLLELVGQERQQGGGANQQGGGASAGQSLANLASRLIADRQSNALIFRGTDAEVEELTRLIEIVDAPSRLIIRRYNAGSMSPIIAAYGQRLGLGPVSSQEGAQSQPFVGSGFALEQAEQEGGGAFSYYGTEQQHQRVRELVDEFAQEVRDQQMVVEFYRLQNATAEDAANLVNELLNIEQDDEVGSSPFVTRSLERRGASISRTDNIDRVSDFGAAVTQDGRAPQPGEVAPGQAGAQAAQPGQQPGAGAEGEPSGITIVEGISVIADTPRNQLIVRAPVRQQREIARVIREIDLRRGQVYIEAQIVSVSSSNTFSITIETVPSDPDSDVPIFTNFGLLSDPKNIDGVRQPFGNGVSAALIDNDFVPLIIQALQTEGSGRLVSQPRLLVNDNEEAELSSTRDEPFAQTTQTVGTPTQTSLGGNVSAGTTLAVRPQISEGGFVRLELSVELSAFGERPNPDLPPVTQSDNLTSAVTVPADTTVVLGGFTQENISDTISKVPILGDIPLIGQAFRSTSKDKSYRTIYIFITPRVLRDPSFSDLRLLTAGPAQNVELELATDLPPLEPALMPIFGIDRARPGSGEDGAP